MPTYLEIIEGEKRIVVAPVWVPTDAEDGFVRFETPLSLNGVIEPGLVLQAGCLIERPDCNVTFEIRLRRTAGRPHIALERLDWRSLKDGHTNKRRSGWPMPGRRLSATHLHLFDYNHLHEQGIMRPGNLPVAVNVPEPLQDFENARDFAGRIFGITNMGLVSRPAWRYLLI